MNGDVMPTSCTTPETDRQTEAVKYHRWTQGSSTTIMFVELHKQIENQLIKLLSMTFPLVTISKDASHIPDLPNE